MITKNITLAGLAIVLAISLSGCSLIPNNQQTSRPVVPVTNNQNKVVAPDLNQPSLVSISNFVFAPQAITIPAGATVTWTNNDTPPHTIKFSDFTSETLATGQSVQHKFDTPGTYQYSCGIHPSMKGTVIVQ